MQQASNEELIAAWRGGDLAARDQLLERLAPDLKAIASAQRRRERGVSFSSGDLVNDAILKLVQMGRIALNDKAHMIALAARLMRRILIDHARQRATDKRDHVRVVLNEELDGEAGPDLIALETALIRLGVIDEGLMALVEMRYFGGMAMGDIAVVTELSEATLKRCWRTARAWLAEVTGGARGAALGMSDAAPKFLEKAETLLVPALAAKPVSHEAAVGFATLRLEQATADLYNSNEPGRARARALEAEAIIKPFARLDAESAALMAMALKTLGDSYGWDNDFQTARTHLTRSEAFQASLPPALQDDDRLLGARSSNLRLLGEALHKLKQPAAARATIDRAIAINRTLVAREPDHPERLRKLSASLWYAAVVHRTNQRIPEARANIDEALAIARRLTARDPRDAGALQTFTTAAEIVAQLRADAGDDAGNRAMFAELRGAHDRMIALGGKAPGPRRSLATVLHTQGTNRQNLGDKAGACQHWRDASAIFAGLAARGELSDFDRNNSLVLIRQQLSQYCSGAAAA